MALATSSFRPARTLVREAQLGDASAVRRIAHRALPRTYRTSLPPGVLEAVLAQTYSIEALERCIAARRVGGHFLVAERGGVVVGYLDFGYGAGDHELHRLYVDPDLTSLGIGRRLLDELHFRRPATAYILMVVAGNMGARRFYAREGFVEAARVDGRCFYAEHMGVRFDSGTPALPCIVLRRSARTLTDGVTRRHEPATENTTSST